MRYDPINKIMVEDNNIKTKDSDPINALRNFKKTAEYGDSIKIDVNGKKVKVQKEANGWYIINEGAVTKGTYPIIEASIKEIAKNIKTKDLEKPYFDPLYKDTRRAIVKEVQNYLSSKGYNNSVGKYDKVVYGVRSLLEKTLLQPGTDKFNDAVHREVDRLLKKYNLTKDSKAEDAIERGEALFRENSYKTIKKIEEHLKNRHYDSAIKLIPELRSHLEFALNSMKNETNY